MEQGSRDSSVARYSTETETETEKIAGSSPCRSGGENFLLQGQLSVLTLILVSAPPVL